MGFRTFSASGPFGGGARMRRLSCRPTDRIGRRGDAQVRVLAPAPPARTSHRRRDVARGRRGRRRPAQRARCARRRRARTRTARAHRRRNRRPPAARRRGDRPGRGREADGRTRAGWLDREDRRNAAEPEQPAGPRLEVGHVIAYAGELPAPRLWPFASRFGSHAEIDPRRSRGALSPRFVRGATLRFAGRDLVDHEVRGAAGLALLADDRREHLHAAHRHELPRRGVRRGGARLHVVLNFAGTSSWWLLYGASASSTPLLTSVGFAPGCAALTSQDASVRGFPGIDPSPPHAFRLIATIAVPNEPALVGASVFHQWLWEEFESGAPGRRRLR